MLMITSTCEFFIKVKLSYGADLYPGKPYIVASLQATHIIKEGNYFHFLFEGCV